MPGTGITYTEQRSTLGVPRARGQHLWSNATGNVCVGCVFVYLSALVAHPHCTALNSRACLGCKGCTATHGTAQIHSLLLVDTTCCMGCFLSPGYFQQTKFHLVHFAGILVWVLRAGDGHSCALCMLPQQRACLLGPVDSLHRWQQFVV